MQEEYLFGCKKFFMDKKKHRQVKLHAKNRPCRGSITGNKDVPWLNVSGEWLKQAGFNIGSQVEITVKQNELIIKTES